MYRSMIFIVGGTMVMYSPRVMAQDVPAPDHKVIVVTENETNEDGIGASPDETNTAFFIQYQ